MLKQCSFVTEMWLDKQEPLTNKKKPHIVFLLRNKVASGADDILDGDGQLNVNDISALQPLVKHVLLVL